MGFRGLDAAAGSGVPGSGRLPRPDWHGALAGQPRPINLRRSPREFETPQGGRTVLAIALAPRSPTRSHFFSRNSSNQLWTTWIARGFSSTIRSVRMMRLPSAVTSYCGLKDVNVRLVNIGLGVPDENVGCV